MAEESAALKNQDTADEDIKGSFLKGDDKDMHRMSSAIGRLFTEVGTTKKNQEMILKTLTDLKEGQKASQDGRRAEMIPNPTGDSGIAKLNEQFTERILRGDVIGVLDEYGKLMSSAKENLSRMNKQKMDRAVEEVSKNSKVFPEIKANVLQTATLLIDRGYSAEDAVAHAYEKHRADYLEKKFTPSEEEFNPDSLDLLKGGRGSQSAGGEQGGKLPPKWEEACQRDIKAGIFKDRKEWLSSLSPKIKATFGLG